MAFKVWDNVQFLYHKEVRYGYVVSIGKDGVSVSMFDGNREKPLKLHESKLTLVPPYCVSEDELGKFLRFEINEKELRGGNVYANLAGDAVYSVTIDDLIGMLNHILEDDNMQDAYERLQLIEWDLDEFYTYGSPEKEGHNSDYDIRGLTPDSQATAAMFYRIYGVFADKCGEVSSDDISLLLRQAEIVKKNFGKPIEEREFTDDNKECFLREWNRNDNDEINHAPENVQQIFKQFTEQLAEKENKTALHCLGYGCYTGGPLWEQNWFRSRDCMLKLMNLAEDNRFYANTLGYIYYYGRCNGGVPEYEKAYQYFSLAAFGGVYEAQYKIADMFEHGYGVEENQLISEEIVNRLYSENIKYIFAGGFGCKFADIALRLSNICTRLQNYYGAYVYALQASFAIRQRMKAVDYYGDSVVASAIEKALTEAKEKLDFKPKRRESSVWLYNVLSTFKNENSLCRAKIERKENGDAKLTIRLFAKQKNERMFLTLPSVAFCGMTDKIAVTIKGVQKITGDEENVIFDTIKGNSLIRNGEPVLTINAERFEIVAPKENPGNVIRFASVEFTPGGKIYDYICDDNVTAGDRVAVITKEGEKTVTVIRTFDKHESELALPLSRYKKIEKV